MRSSKRVDETHCQVDDDDPIEVVKIIVVIKLMSTNKGSKKSFLR